MGLTQLETLTSGQVDDLHELYRNEWWTADRDRADLEPMVSNSDVIVAFGDDVTGELVAFARVLTDSVYKALVFDVIVAPDHRGTGLGDRLLSAVVDHPDLSGVESFELYCLEELVPFYERWGFSEDVGDVRLMRRR